jgi:hypothetical protein
MSIHPSGWFRYMHSSFEMRTGQHVYLNCTLLCDLPFDASTRQPMMVTFHQDALCVQGAWLPVIIERADGQVIGWTDDEDPVMDLYILGNN